MENSKHIEEFNRLVNKKFNLYNSMFLNLPYRKVENVGMLIPILQRWSKSGLEEGKEPLEILNSFFEGQTNLKTEMDRIDFMFQVIQYVERQVVLFDSVEDVALPEIRQMEDDLTIRDFFHQMDHRISAEDIRSKLQTFSARIVLTAHPTQFYPPRVLDIMSRLRHKVRDNDINGIDILLQQLGLSSLLNPEKPTPLEEARNIIYFLRNVYYDASGQLMAHIRTSTQDEGFDNPNVVKLGFWPGGDRDGNPFVTSDTTIAVANELRMSLMKCYYRDIKQLERKLTFKGVESLLKELRGEVYKAMFDPDHALPWKEILNPLLSVKENVEQKYNSLYKDDIDNLIDKVKIFKSHFANLDIRQNHSIHKLTVETILKKAGIIQKSLEELTEDELIDILVHQDIKIGDLSFANDLVTDTIQTVMQIDKIQEKNGEEGCNRYIISNSEDIFAVLFVHALLRWFGQFKEYPKVDIVPLFESMRGMDNAEQIMKRLFNIPEYRKHLALRNDCQTIMLGFSDGTKDGGYLKANWSIFKTKEILSETCAENGISAIFFDGRGGPPARGGGRTHRFYAAQSDRIASHEIQVTIQGQTISSKYGTQEQFAYNIEQLLTAGLYHALFKSENFIPGEARSLIEKLSNISFEKYTALKHHPKFIPYLEKMSTLKYYGAANIGSRPVKRGQKKKLELSDLRAISYVGSWSQLKQNVPGYFGIGTALKTLKDEGRLGDLKQLFNTVPFFKALMLNSMMSLYKCYFELTAYMDKNDGFSDFWEILYDEYKLSKSMLLEISGYEQLMEEEPVSRSSVEIREKIVLPLLVIQQYALQMISKNVSHKSSYEKIVQRSLYGNINASRNSA
ncbi:MAG: phosphoenolpyruvate carboxylase [Bacteroidetes bacterium]|nr:phosphoenolpyruvate carboxylase [Bacteroidota bacterium]